MGTSRGKEKKREEVLQTQADTATAEWQPSELEKQQESRVSGFLKDWDSGKDVKDISFLRPFMNLFQGAKTGQAAEKLGAGALNLSGAGAGGMAEVMRQQNQLRKEEAASGQLYDSANGAYQYASGTLAPSLMGMSENRLSGKAQLANQRYNSYLNRPKTPSPWMQLLTSGIGAAGAAASGGATFGL